MDTNELIETLKKIEATIIGKRCWSLIIGTGSLLTLAFGEKLARSKPLRNPSLSDDQRNFDGEYELYISCAWRLQTVDAVICTSTCGNLTSSRWQSDMKALVGVGISNMAVRMPGADLEITFENGNSLVVFADQANEVDKYLNYAFSNADSTFINGPRSVPSVERRK